MSNFYSTADTIRKMLSPYTSFTTSQLSILIQTSGKWAIFVNKSIYWEFVKILELQYPPTSWDHNLQIDKKFFDMKLIMLTIDTIDRFMFITDLIFESQFSMPWLGKLTLFSDLASYHILEKFIQQNGLEKSIESIVDQKCPAITHKTIRVVSFVERTDKYDITKKFGDIMQLSTIDYLFVTCAFPWLQPFHINQLVIPWKNYRQLNTVVPIILNHLSTINYTNELNIFDLVSLKLAVTDVRGHASHLSSQIDYFIARLLRQMVHRKTYIRDNTFDLIQYLYDMDSFPSVLLIKFFLYEFQNYIHTIQANERWVELQQESNILIKKIIMLRDEVDPIQILNLKTNVQFTIDGRYFSQMTFRLFTDLMAYDSVIEIILDTRYSWNSEKPVINKSIKPRHLRIIFFGDNTACFIEDFVSSLKTMTYPNDTFDLMMAQKMSSYIVFDRFVCNTLHFESILIDSKILLELNQCNTLHIKTIKFVSCTFENAVENWESYYSVKKISAFEIHEDESTWQYLFEFIANRLIDTSRDEFQFDRDLGIRNDGLLIRLNTLRFRLDEFKTKLQIFHDDNQMIDLYDIKQGMMYDVDKCNFQFYQ